jgi:hypothetical protein
MATITLPRCESGAQNAIHNTGAVTVAQEYTSTTSSADTIHFAKIPANATVTDIKVGGVDGAGGGNVTLGWTADPDGFLAAVDFDSTTALTHRGNLSLPKTFTADTDAVVVFTAALTGNKKIGVSITYTTEFLDRS